MSCKISKSSTNIMFEFPKFSINFYNELLCFLNKKEHNWIIIRPIHFEIELDYQIRNWDVVVEILGMGVHFSGLLPANERAKEFKDKLDVLSGVLADSFHVWGSATAKDSLKTVGKEKFFRTRKLARTELKGAIKRYFVQ